MQSLICCRDFLRSHRRLQYLLLLLTSSYSSSFFFFYCYAHHRDLHSFPTRRSSDLLYRVVRQVTQQANLPMPKVAILPTDRKSTRLNSSHRCISYAVFCLKKKSNCNAQVDG